MNTIPEMNWKESLSCLNACKQTRKGLFMSVKAKLTLAGREAKAFMSMKRSVMRMSELQPVSRPGGAAYVSEGVAYTDRSRSEGVHEHEAKRNANARVTAYKRNIS